ncbi:MAG: hypothetical protein IPK63_18755 [Candidatus Competibacteraceae bacterium]|nr:hypothetical protein [Candidatus Competibacteraceae bacterium]
MGVRLILIVLFLTGCTIGQAPHVADTTLTGAIISSGGVELNPLGFPMVVVAKVATEGIAAYYKKEGDYVACQVIASSARLGSSIGVGATLGGLVLGGIPGIVFGGMVAAGSLFNYTQQTATEDCYPQVSTE